MYSYAVSQNALLRMKDGNGLVEVWWPVAAEWHVLPELEAWFEGRPVNAEEAAQEFGGVDLEAATVSDPDSPEGGTEE